jgi:hypothetical protein
VHRLHQGQESQVKAQHLVFGVVDDPGNLLGVQRGLMVCSTRPEPLTPKYISMWR